MSTIHLIAYIAVASIAAILGYVRHLKRAEKDAIKIASEVIDSVTSDVEAAVLDNEISVKTEVDAIEEIVRELEKSHDESERMSMEDRDSFFSSRGL